MNLSEIKNSMRARLAEQKSGCDYDRMSELKNQITEVWNQVSQHELNIHEEMNRADETFTIELREEYDKLLAKCRELSAELNAFKESEGGFAEDVSTLTHQISQLTDVLEERKPALVAKARAPKYPNILG